MEPKHPHIVIASKKKGYIAYDFGRKFGLDMERTFDLPLRPGSMESLGKVGETAKRVVEMINGEDLDEDTKVPGVTKVVVRLYEMHVYHGAAFIGSAIDLQVRAILMKMLKISENDIFDFDIYEDAAEKLQRLVSPPDVPTDRWRRTWVPFAKSSESGKWFWGQAYFAVKGGSPLSENTVFCTPDEVADYRIDAALIHKEAVETWLELKNIVDSF